MPVKLFSALINTPGTLRMDGSQAIVRASGKGASGAILKKSASRAGLKVIESPELARHFAAASARTEALPEALRRELAEIWPQRTGV